MNKNKRLRQKIYHATEGEVLYSVATGHVNPLKKASRQAVKFMCSQEGYVAVHNCERGVLWYYDSLNAAKGARNNARAIGIICGDNICRFVFKSGQFVLEQEQ